MPNPIFAPAVWTVDETYTVTQTDFLAVDIWVEDIDNSDASVTLTLPAGAEAEVLANPVDWATAGQPILTGGVWTPGAIPLGDWTVSVNVVGAPTGPQSVSLSNPTGTLPTGILRIVIRGLAGAAATIEPGGGTLSIDRLLADPSVSSVFVASPALPLKEGTVGITLGAVTASSELVNGAPMVPLVPAPARIDTWQTDPANATAVRNFAPAGTSATFDAPAVYADTDVNFTLSTSYDLDASGTADPTEPANAEVLPVTIEPVTYGMVLAVDRSGSMGSALGAGNKWEQAVNAAHAWMDLFTAFRPGGAHKAGVMTFQNDSCSWTDTPHAQLPFLDPSDGTALPGPDSNLLQPLDFFENNDTWNLGDVASCTPIGDGLIRSWEAIAAAQSDVDSGAVILLTDGYENAGSVTIEETAGAAASTFEDLRDVGALAGANAKIGPRVFALGVGTSVQSDRLEVLATDGHYAQITDSVDVLNALAEMLGAVLSAERAGPLLGVVDPDSPSNALYFAANTGEQVMTILVPLPTPGQTVSVAWRPQGDPNFVPINPADAHLELTERTNHILLRIDLTNLPSATPTGSEWRVQRMDGGTPQVLTDADVLAMADLHVQTEMFFGRKTHFTDEPIDLFCRITAGGAPITDAQVLVDVARPGEGLGTFLSTNSKLYDKKAQSQQFDGRDPDKGKAHMIRHLLNATGQADLPIVSTPDFELKDNGPTGGGAIGDGLWAARYGDTTLEGTYTFRFRVLGRMPNGSRFARTILKSIYLAVRPSVTGSDYAWATTDELQGGQAVSILSITPKSASGQYLGPFRADKFAISVADGSISGALTDALNGSYQLRVLHDPADNPVVSVSVYGTPLRPSSPRGGLGSSGVSGMTCWQIFVALLVCVWRAILRLFGIR